MRESGAIGSDSESVGGYDVQLAGAARGNTELPHVTRVGLTATGKQLGLLRIGRHLAFPGVAAWDDWKCPQRERPTPSRKKA